MGGSEGLKGGTFGWKGGRCSCMTELKSVLKEHLLKAGLVMVLSHFRTAIECFLIIAS